MNDWIVNFDNASHYIARFKKKDIGRHFPITVKADNQGTITLHNYDEYFDYVAKYIVDSWKHPVYGDIKKSPKTLVEMISNLL